ncbi:hypothetical protein jhhlp_000276 [Lomentospora prolificans]|uniref:Uncharacterized protein n=1 Tax=Lomentospora prolificans TaxID=41688 RepID=A0A2N3NKF9_9PEZI|nr:hypothetical protein jhhlp_000276 [Lomentospora prolificans]
MLSFLLRLLRAPIRIPVRIFRLWLRFLWRPVRFQWFLVPWRILLVGLTLLSLPAALTGVAEGIFYGVWADKTYYESLDNFVYNVESAQWMDQYSVPGGPGIHDTALGPFSLVQLRDPTNWWERVGLKRFDLPGDPGVLSDEVPVDQYANLNVLYRRIPWSTKPKKPWHHFIFASRQIAGVLLDEWDHAFNDLLQYHYKNPAVGNATFQYITCPTSFLCDVWKVRGPSFLHFTTEVPTLDDGSPDPEVPERDAIPGYDPVYVRVFEFPRIEDYGKALHLPRGVFPTYFEQLRSVTENPGVWQTESVYTDIQQVLQRSFEIAEDKKYEYPLTYGKIRALDIWVLDQFAKIDPAGEESLTGYYAALVRLLCFSLSYHVRFFIVRSQEFISALFLNFFGVGWKDKLNHQMDLDGDDGEYVASNFWDQMMVDFWDFAMQKMSENATAAAKAATDGADEDLYQTTPGPDMRWAAA